MRLSTIALAAAITASGSLQAQSPPTVGIQLVSPDRDDSTIALPVYQPRISADGNTIVYASPSTRLVADAVDGSTDVDVFAFDVACNTTQIVSNAWDGSAGNGGSGLGDEYRVSVSGDGRYVVFVSHATNLVKNGPPDDSATDVYLVDRSNNYTIDGARVRRISVAPNNAEPNGRSFDPVISADGRFVTFASAASNLLPIDGDDDNANGDNCDIGEGCDENGHTVDIFRYTIASPDGEIVLVSRGNTAATNDHSDMPTIDEDGSEIVYRSNAGNLGSVAIPFFSSPHAYRWNAAGTTIVDGVGTIATTSDIAEHGVPDYPAVSGDGKVAAFVSRANLLQPGDTTDHVFVRRFETSQTIRVTVAGTGGADPVVTKSPSLSQNGNYVAFASTHPTEPDSIYRRDLINGNLVLVSRGVGNQAEDGRSQWPSISANGKRVAFRSNSTNLIANQFGNADAAYLAYIGPTSRSTCTPRY
jgi:Tol biopolymer transport system component